MTNTKKKLSNLLAKYIPQNISFIDKCKIIYRPYITPFVDLLNLIPMQSSTFDIGCGNGALLNLIYQIKDPIKIGGVEISSKLVENANELLKQSIGHYKNLKVDISKYDGMNLPMLTEYDYVLLVDVVHHIPKDKLISFLSILKRNMRPGSTLILKDIDAGKPFLVLFNKLHDLIVSHEIGNEISLHYALNILVEIGFKIKSTTYKRMLWYPHYTIIATA